MSTDVLSLSNRNYDDPWHRLYWTVPAAIAIWFAILWSFSIFMGNPSERLPDPPAVDAQIVEIPEPAPPSVKSLPVKQSQPKAEPQPAIPQPSLEKAPPPKPEANPVEEPNNIPTPTSPKVEATPAPQEPPHVANNVKPYAGARAISQPIPQIPEELRQDALSTSAVARFHVAPDGTTTAELIKPTPNPKLNRLLLTTLKNWRFFPAMKDGKPVASTEEIVIKIQVK